MSSLTIEPLTVPLRLDEHGTFRISDTRIPLERVIECHLQGYSPEAIIDSFPDLRLADVLAVLAYYLTHEPEMEQYRRQQQEAADEVMARIEASQPPSPTRAELLARRREGK
jgi:uncharacterized protein (DUF433 family)